MIHSSAFSGDIPAFVSDIRPLIYFCVVNWMETFWSSFHCDYAHVIPQPKNDQYEKIMTQTASHALLILYAKIWSERSATALYDARQHLLRLPLRVDINAEIQFCSK